MRKLIVIIFILVGLHGFSQPSNSSQYLVQSAKWKFVKPQWLDSGLYVKNIVKLSSQNRVCVFDSTNGKVGYKFLDLSGYVPYTGATTNVNIGTNTYIGHSLKSDASDGVLIEAANGTDVGIFGAGNTANSSLYGGLTVGSLTSGNGTDSVVVASSAGLLKKRPASAFGSTYTAGRGLTLNSSTFRLDTTQFYTWKNARTLWNSAPTATVNYGLVSFGSGPFDGVTVGYFNGAAAGTLIAGNLASGSTSDLLNLQVGGVSCMRLNGAHLTVAGSITANGGSKIAAAQDLTWLTRAAFQAPASGVFLMTDAAYTSFNRLQFGGTTSSFPSIKRSTTTLEARLADDSGYSAVQSLYDRFGSGSPESVVTAPIGAIYHRTDGGAGTSLYVKESGTGSTGWIAK